ncbi:MAG: XdhC/CoxI family protein [Clostridiales bacterium]|nr:XdhC/CoxI family protein [Clostridiales bacterium]
MADIIEQQGSTPREKGAQMLVWLREDSPGEKGLAIAGTVGGGRLEAEVIEKARACLSSGQESALHAFDLTGEDAAEMDMICGGSGTVLITVFTSRDAEVLDLARQAIVDKRRAWLVTLLEGDATYSAYVDDYREPTSGCELSEAQLKLIRDSAGPAMHIHDDESIIISARMLTPGPSLYIFGGGHVGLATANLCHLIGFETVIIDDREEFANTERFPHSQCIVTAEGEALSGFAFDDNAYVLIMTRGHLLDYDWLKWVLSLSAMPKYVGMIGSRRKIALIYERLEREGIQKDRIRQVYSPVGLPIAAQTPEEIAVSIAAQLIQIRNNG